MFIHFLNLVTTKYVLPTATTTIIQYNIIHRNQATNHQYQVLVSLISLFTIYFHTYEGHSICS